MSTSRQISARTHLRIPDGDILQVAASRFQTAIQGSPIALALQDADLRYTWVYNPLAGFNSDGIIGKDEADIHSPEDAALLTALKREVLQTGLGMRREIMMERQGEAGYFDVTISPLRDPDGTIVGVTSTAIDITERKRVESERARLLHERVALLESSAHGIFGVDMEGNCTFINRACAEMLGYAPEEVMGRNMHELAHYVHADGSPYSKEDSPVYQSLRFGTCMQVEEDVIWRRDGTPSAVEYSTAPIIVSGRMEGCVVTITDISERKRADRVLREQAQIIGQINDSVILTDMGGYITYWNSGATRIFGYQPTEALGRHIALICFDEDHTYLQDEVIRPAIRDGICKVEMRARKESGEEIFLHLSISLVRDAAAHPIGMLGYSIDITDRKQALAELRKAKEAAEAASRAKDRFLAMLSHELRTPLAPVLASVEALESDPEFTAGMRPFIDVIRRNVELEVRLIDDLLDHSRIANGKLQLKMEVTDLHTLMNGVLENCRADLKEKELRVTVDLSARRHHVMADPARMQQVLWNLVRNSIKFTPRGGSIDIRSRNHPDGRLSIDVEDNGIGIEPATLPLVFDAFEQGVRGEFGGLGLGLAISRNLAEMHGGELTAWSEGRGQGAMFTLTLATETRSDAEPQTSSGGEPEDVKTILVVEEHADMATVMRLLLERKGYRVRVAANMMQALELAQREAFGLVISDVEDAADGGELMRMLSARGNVRGIALAGFGMEEDLKRSIEAGFAEHLTKPISYQKLRQVIDRLLC